MQILVPYTKHPDPCTGSPKRPGTSRHKAGKAAPGLSCVARFERSAWILADRGDLANQLADRAVS